MSLTPLIRQTWTMSAVLINMLAQGLILALPFSLLPALNHPESQIKVDLHMSSWLGSITAVSNIPGYILSSVFSTLYGRKLVHVLAMLPSIGGCLMIYFAKDFSMLMMGRFLTGLTTGATVYLGAIVIGEYTAPNYRGLFLYLKNATVCIGATLAHILSGYLDWRTLALVSSVPLYLSLIITFTWPESSAWLASKHQYEQSAIAFNWLRGDNETSRKELEELIKTQKAMQSKVRVDVSYWDKVIIFLAKFKQKDFLRPLTIIILASILLEVSGRHVFPTYALQIMTELTGKSSQSYYYILAIDVTITVSALVGSILSKIMTRRSLLFSTGFSALVVLILNCVYLFLVSKGIVSDDRSWIPVTLLGLFFVLTNFGCAPMPLTLVGEIFPLSHRDAGSALSGTWTSVCLMAALKSTPHLLVNAGACGLFAVFSSIMGVSLFILYFILPETKDRTLLEIEFYFHYGKFENSNVFKSDDDREVNVKMIS